MIILATPSFPAVYHPNADRWNAARSYQKNSSGATQYLDPCVWLPSDVARLFIMFFSSFFWMITKMVLPLVSNIINSSILGSGACPESWLQLFVLSYHPLLVKFCVQSWGLLFVKSWVPSAYSLRLSKDWHSNQAGLKCSIQSEERAHSILVRMEWSFHS